MRVASHRARRPAAANQNHPGRNKNKDGAAATSCSHPLGALDHAVRVVHGVCCLAGPASLIDDLRAELRVEGVPSAIRRHDTATLFDWLIAALSYQGISDRVASDYFAAQNRFVQFAQAKFAIARHRRDQCLWRPSIGGTRS